MLPCLASHWDRCAHSALFLCCLKIPEPEPNYAFNPDVQVLDYLLAQHLKSVKDKLEVVHLPLTSFATQWLMCAFVNVLPLASVLKVWDTMMLEGPAVLFRVSLAMLKAVEGELSLAREMEDAMAALNRARNLEIQTVLMIACGTHPRVHLPTHLRTRTQGPPNKATTNAVATP